MSAINVKEGQSGWIQFTLMDEDGNPVAKSLIDSLTLTLYRDSDLSTINGRSAQSILDVNGGEVDDTSGVVRWTYGPSDTPFLGSDTCRTQIEKHIAAFHWTWDGGTKSYWFEVAMNVRNSRLYSVE